MGFAYGHCGMHGNVVYWNYFRNAYMPARGALRSPHIASHYFGSKAVDQHNSKFVVRLAEHGLDASWRFDPDRGLVKTSHSILKHLLQARVGLLDVFVEDTKCIIDKAPGSVLSAHDRGRTSVVARHDI